MIHKINKSIPIYLRKIIDLLAILLSKKYHYVIIFLRGDTFEII